MSNLTQVAPILYIIICPFYYLTLNTVPLALLQISVCKFNSLNKNQEHWVWTQTGIKNTTK